MSDTLSERQAFMILNDLPNIGPVTLHRLLEEFGGDPRDILAAPRRRLESVRGVGPETSDALANWRTHFDLTREEERLAKAGATLYGQSVAKKLGADLARLGFCVVSGLARGIDTAAHEGALSVGGKTAAVLGCGIDIVYPPENLGLYRQIAETGAVLSEFPFGRKADKQTFPMRNRVVSGMCEAIVVVESDVSGGAMITARFAGEQGRLIYAVPGRIDQPSSAGCHQLIRDGATLFTSIDDILNELNYLDGLRPKAITTEGQLGLLEQLMPQLDATEQRVIAAFSGGALLGVDALTAATGLGSSEVSVALMGLELKKLVLKRADGTFEARSYS